MQARLTTSIGMVRKRITTLPPIEPRRYRPVFAGVATILVALFSIYATRHLPYFPSGWQALLILIAGVIWFLRPQQGVWFTSALLILPIAYNLPFGAWGLVITAIVMLVCMRLFEPYSFLIFAVLTILFARSLFLPLIFVAPLACAFLGISRGAVFAGLAAFWLELLMIIGGRRTVGLLAGGNHAAPIIHTQPNSIDSLINYRWLNVHGDPGLAVLDAAKTVFTPFVDRPILLGQIALWAATAALVARVIQHPFTRRLPKIVQAVGSGSLLLIVGQIALSAILARGGADIEGMIIAALASGIVVIVVSPLIEIAPQALLNDGDSRPYSSTSGSLAPSLMPGKAGNTKEQSHIQREIPTDTWADLAGIDDIRREVQEALDSQFDTPTREMLQRMSIPPTRGILLFGPPGTGKTKIARVIAHEAGASFMAISGTEFTSKWYGESEANLRRIFEEAKAHRPTVLFFDEVEAFLPKRSEMARSDAPERGVIATFLAYTDGVAATDGVLLVGATNYPNLIDPAALRPGRFDKVIYLSAPDQEARQRIVGRYLQGRKLAEDVDLERLASRMERFTGADIQRVCTEASRRALERTRTAPRTASSDPETLTMADLEQALGGTKPSVTIRMLREYEALADQYGRRSEKTASINVIARLNLHWSDVAGLDEVKRVLREAIEMPLAHPELFTQYRVKPHKGVLLFGPPGCGKTFLAKVVASEANAHFLQVRGPELLQKFVGESENQLRELFARARENAPCVLFFDEIDAIGLTRGNQEASHTQILTQLLTEMDGFEELKGVVVVAATNRPDSLDPALLRPGRFDRLLYIPPPDLAGRLQLLNAELVNRPVADDIETQHLADMLDGYSAADITSICNSAAFATATATLLAGEPQPITMKILLDQVQRTPRSISPEDIATYELLRDRLQR